MKLIKIFIFLLISLVISTKASSNEDLLNSLKEGGKLIFIRHAYAPGSGDPKNFDIEDCSTQRNLNQEGKNQAKNIGLLFKQKNISIDYVISSQWCRCKETASIAFQDKYQVKDFLNSFYEQRFVKNKHRQVRNLKKHIDNWKGKKNLILVTHYVVISEILNYNTYSGEIVISDKNYKVIGSFKTKF